MFLGVEKGFIGNEWVSDTRFSFPFLALISGDPERSLRLAQALLKVVEEASLRDLPNKNEVMGNIHSCIGNAFVDIELLNKALKHHQKDLDISKKRLALVNLVNPIRQQA